ncbi:hypothetical protein ANN_02116 [Periplaneta americana]|uniref:DUF7869 domain-containing protein n=1 Tax=Periplaneta americana TaxID=6978 RepID=A0ABQ8TVD3_PERAM|nr:hypothetical protein ANN_02116 [Periplaneta americana]
MVGLCEGGSEPPVSLKFSARQNKNRMILMVVIYIIAKKHFDSVDLKFLVSEHSYMPCDKEFGIIEKKMQDHGSRRGDNAGEMSPGSSTESYTAFAHIGLRENPGRKPHPGNLPQPGIESGPPGFAARRANLYSTVSQSKQASLVYRSSTRVCVRNCVSIRRPEFECSGPQLEGPEFQCSGPQLEGPEFEYSELSLKTIAFSRREIERAEVTPMLAIRLPLSNCHQGYYTAHRSVMEAHLVRFLVYADDVNMLGENSQTIRENAEILLEASKAIGLEVNPGKTKYMIMSRDQNIVRNGNMKIGDLSFEEVKNSNILEQQFWSEQAELVKLPTCCRMYLFGNVLFISESQITGLEMNGERDFGVNVSSSGETSRENEWRDKNRALFLLSRSDRVNKNTATRRKFPSAYWLTMCFPFHNSNTNTPLHAIVIQTRKEAEIKPERIERLLSSLNQTTETSENRNCQSSENRKIGNNSLYKITRTEEDTNEVLYVECRMYGQKHDHYDEVK